MDNYSVPAPPMNPAQSMQQPNLSAGGPTGLLAGMLWKDQYDKYNQQQDTSQQMRQAELANYLYGQKARNAQTDYNTDYSTAMRPMAGAMADAKLAHDQSVPEMNNAQGASMRASTIAKRNEIAAEFTAQEVGSVYDSYTTTDKDGITKLPSEKHKALGEQLIKDGHAQRLLSHMQKTLGPTDPAVLALQASMNNPLALARFAGGAMNDRKMREQRANALAMGAQRLQYAKEMNTGRVDVANINADAKLKAVEMAAAAHEKLMKAKEEKFNLQQEFVRLNRKIMDGTAKPEEVAGAAKIKTQLDQLQPIIQKAEIDFARSRKMGMPTPDAVPQAAPASVQPGATMKFDKNGNPL